MTQAAAMSAPAKRRSVDPDANWKRRYPAFLMPAVVALRWLLAWRNPLVRQEARLNMRFLLENTRPDADIDRLARKYIWQWMWRGERRWRPGLITSLPVEGIAEFLAGRDPERGVVLTFMHHANYEGFFPSIDKAGLHCHAVGMAEIFRDDMPPIIKQHVKICEMGATGISTEQGSAGIVAALEAKAVVAIAPDVAGRTPVTWVGREVRGSFGPARLAYETNSQVVIATFHKDRKAPARIRLHALIEPRDFPDAGALLAHMLGVHEAAILEWPEAADRPMQRFVCLDDDARKVFGEGLADPRAM